MHCAHTSAQAHKGRTRGRVKLILQPVGLEPARSCHLMLRQKDHSANAEHCDTGTPEIRIHIPAGTGRSTVTVEIYRTRNHRILARSVRAYMYVCTGTLLSYAQMHGIISPIGHLLTQYRSAIYRCTQFILLSLVISQ